MSILDIFKNSYSGKPKASSETETVRKIIQALDQLEPGRAKFIAGFAYLLGRAARADMHISLKETQKMERILMDRGGLPEEQAIIVVQMAKTQNVLFGGTENFLVTREFRESADHEQKLALLDCLYAVAATEDYISTIEDNEISQIADELRIEHHDFISVRSGYRSSLAVFQDEPKP
ncbi:MAG: TerB family tellurite resistance protein [Acidobacteria bacterium]|nr:TerB family tellurite resistance protein [Acidobacteriota bacterium]